MFKVPDWDEDNTSIKKKGKSKKQWKNDTTPSPKKLLKPKKNMKKIQQKTPPQKHVAKVEEIKSLPKKRKLNEQIVDKKKKKNKKLGNIPNLDTDKADELILEAKKKKFYAPIKRDDEEDVLFGGQAKQVLSVAEKKKERIRAMLAQNNPTRNSITVSSNKLRDRMLDRLKAAQFRYLNEKLYTSSGGDAKELFQNDPAAFRTYHQGYQQQLKKWPVNPLHVIAKKIRRMPKTHTIADMGCGEATLSKLVPQSVRSFDLVASAPGVEACDMARTPLLSASVDAAVYCLALMGTGLTEYLLEANRVLKMGGHLLIAEVESRFENVEEFAKEVTRLGFKLKNLDKTHKVFFFLEFVKIRDPPAKKAKLPHLTLKPCLYKKR